MEGYYFLLLATTSYSLLYRFLIVTVIFIFSMFSLGNVLLWGKIVSFSG
jgi:hypothetical protein